jgi:hypothetical protein
LRVRSLSGVIFPPPDRLVGNRPGDRRWRFNGLSV